MMKQFNKQILEAIDRGILLALDDYEEQSSNNIIPVKDTIYKNNSIRYSLEYDELKKKMDTLTETYFFVSGEEPKITKEEYLRFVELSNLLKRKYEYVINHGFSAFSKEPTKGNLKLFIHNIKFLLLDGDDDGVSIISLDKISFNKFETDLNWINTSRETNMSYLFENSNFNCDISEWDTSNVTDMSYMFRSCRFNKDISKWNTSKVEKMTAMFKDSDFNLPIGNWDVSNVKNMYLMFEFSNFNLDISKWDTHNVRSMAHMFAHTNFNLDISNWDVSNVTNMLEMFNGNHKFRYNLSNWNVAKVQTYTGFFDTGAHMPYTYKPKFRGH